MIRKNDPSAAKSVTQTVLANLPASSDSSSSSSSSSSKTPNNEAPLSFPDVLQALKSLNALKGVGPATASLILSAHSPATTPFFEDELYIWLCRTESLRRKEKTELKYTVKEYEELWGRVQEVRERVRDEEGRRVEASVLEKAAFVIAHGMKAEEEGGDGVEESRVGKTGAVKGTTKKRRLVEEEDEKDEGSNELGKAKTKRKTGKTRN